MYSRPDETCGRICLWYAPDRTIRQVTLDAWDVDGELATVEVVSVGPFDDPLELVAGMVDRLTAQGALF